MKEVFIVNLDEGKKVAELFNRCTLIDEFAGEFMRFRDDNGLTIAIYPKRRIHSIIKRQLDR